MKSARQSVVILIAVAMILVAVGLIFVNNAKGGRQRNEKGENGVRTFSEPVKELVFEAGVCKIEIVSGDTDEYILSYENLTYGTLSDSLKDGTLKITYKPDDRWTGKMIKLKDIDDQKITLTIPKNAFLERALFEVGAADVEVEQMVAKQLYITVGAGKIDADYLKASEEAKLTVGAGSFSAEDVDLMNAELECGVGEMNLSGKIEGDISADCGLGVMELDLNEEQKEYRGELDCGLGKLHFGDIRIERSGKQQYGTSSAKNRMNIKCGLGEVDVYFQK